MNNGTCNIFETGRVINEKVLAGVKAIHDLDIII